MDALHDVVQAGKTGASAPAACTPGSRQGPAPTQTGLLRTVPVGLGADRGVFADLQTGLASAAAAFLAP